MESCQEEIEQWCNGSGTEDVEIQTNLSCQILATNEDRQKELEEKLCEFKRKRSELGPERDIGLKLKRLEDQIVKLEMEVKQKSLEEDAFKDCNGEGSILYRSKHLGAMYLIFYLLSLVQLKATINS